MIDRRELKKDVYTTTEWNGDVHRIIYEASVDDAQTIIEADSEYEIWEGMHSQVIAPKGTFDRLFNEAKEAEEEDDGI